MAHNTDQVGFPMIPLSGGMELRLEALNPTVDAQVAGVTASRWSIYGTDDSTEPQEDVIPMYTPEMIETV